jgi:hypothetical protein
MNKSRAFSAIVSAGLVVGILDITSAFIIWSLKGVTLTRGLQGMAAPLVGQESFQGGLATAALGLAIHFFIALVVTTVFYLASRKFIFLTQHAVVSGLLYGIAVYLFMYWLVLPLAFAKFRHSISNDAPAVIVRMILIGLPMALIVRRYSQGAVEQQV